MLLPATTLADEIVAVFDVEVRGAKLGKDAASRLTDYLTGQIAAAGGFRVIPRATVNATVREQRKRSYEECYDEACHIELGKELAAELSLAAQVVQIGDRCTVTLSLIDLAKAATDRASTSKGACTEEGIAGAIDDAVAKLGKRPAAVPDPAKPRCEIVLGPEVCPGTGSGDRTFDDPAEGTAADPARCLARAKDWFSYCASSSPVTARHLSGGKVTEATHGPASRCEIDFGEERCPSSPETGRLANDDAEGAGSDRARCLRRAKEYVQYCGSSAVTARFIAGAKVIASETVSLTTRCRIDLGPERCPRVPDTPPIFNDDHQGADRDGERCKKRAAEYFGYCGSAGPVIARFIRGAEIVHEERHHPPTRCQIVLGPDRCPGNPDIGPVFNDDAEGAGSNEERCLERALEYFQYCGTAGPVTARYFQGTNLVREERAQPKTRCEITFSPERCPANPALMRAFNDAYDGSDGSAARCSRRALEYFQYCGAADGITARFYEGTTLIAQQEAKPPSRCEISLPQGCPKSPSLSRLNDDYEGAGSNVDRCMRRAPEYAAYCGAPKAVARFYDGKALVRTSP